MSEFDLVAVTAAIISGLEAQADDDSIRLEMFKLGVPFNKINPLFKDVSIDAGFRTDPKIARDNIGTSLEDVDLSTLADWDAVALTAGNIAEEVEGATEGMVVAAMKRLANEQEIELPKKPKAGPRSRGASKIKSMIVDLFNANPEINSTELLQGIIGEVTGDYRVRNCIEYVNMYLPMMVAAKNGVALSEVKLGGFDKPALEAEYGGTTSYTAGASDDTVSEDDFDEDEAA